MAFSSPPSAKRARTSSADCEAPPPITLRGGPALPKALVDQFREGNFCDLNIKVEGKLLRAQRLVLSGSSEFFRGLILGGGAQMGDEELELHDMSASLVELAIEWIYTGQCVVPVADIYSMLEVASRLGIGSLEQSTAWAIVGACLDASTCFDIREAGERLYVPSLTEEATRYMLTHFDELAHGGSLCSLSDGCLLELMQSDQLVCTSEEVVLDTLLAWGRHHTPRAADLAKLLQALRFNRFTDCTTASRVATEPLFDSHECMAVVARKLAETSNPAVDRPSKRKQLDLCKEMDVEEKKRRMTAVCRQCKDAATYAHNLEIGNADVQRAFVGPLYLLMSCKQTAFSAVFNEVAPPKKLMTSFVRLVRAVAGPPVPGGVSLYTNEIDTFRPPARPPARSLRRFIPRGTAAYNDAHLAWGDEVLHLRLGGNDRQCTPEQARSRVLSVLSDVFGITKFLLCTCLLPAETITAMHDDIQRHQELAGVARNDQVIAIAMPGLVSAVKLTDRDR